MNFLKTKTKIVAEYGDKKEEDSQEYFAYYLIRPISFWIAALFALFNVSANSVTWLSLVFGLLGFFTFFIGGHESQIIASIFILIWLILDHVDGNLARYYKTQSLFGDFLDSLVCYIVFALIPISIAYSVSNNIHKLDSEELYILGWMFSIGFVLPRLIYQKFKQIDNKRYKNVLSGSENTSFFCVLFNFINNLFNPSGMMVPLLILSAIFQYLEVFLIFYGVGYFSIFIYSSIKFISKTKNL